MNDTPSGPEYGFPDERQIRNPYTRAQQVQRVGWWVGSALLFKPSPRPCYAWRRAVLRGFGAGLADHVCIQRSARIEFPWNLTMGRYASIGEQAWIYNLAPVTIGDFATVSHRAFLCTGTHDFTRPELPLVTQPICIGRGAWIGADAFVSPGVTIGDNAVIGARAVVTRDMPEAMVCAGNPCRPLKPRLPGGQPAPGAS
jgi:putative colanic acid biosynthesis acetyltransferase WcaF